MEEIEKNKPDTFSLQRLQPVVAGFLTELNPNTDTLWNWIESTKSESKEDLKYLGGNAATLLCMLDRNALAGRDLSKAILMEANLFSADLRETNLNETFMKDVNIVNAQFFRKDLESGRISNFTTSVLILLKAEELKMK